MLVIRAADTGKGTVISAFSLVVCEARQPVPPPAFTSTIGDPTRAAFQHFGCFEALLSVSSSSRVVKINGQGVLDTLERLSFKKAGW